MAGEPYTITITYTNGTTSMFTGCVELVESDKTIRFKGKRQGDEEVREWTIVLSNVLEWSKKSEK